jgi:hypothetical protein
MGTTIKLRNYVSTSMFYRMVTIIFRTPKTTGAPKITGTPKISATPKTPTIATPIRHRQSFLDRRLGLRKPCEKHDCIDRAGLPFSGIQTSTPLKTQSELSTALKIPGICGIASGRYAHINIFVQTMQKGTNSNNCRGRVIRAKILTLKRVKY